jgi:tRNA-splicing ligase RtcB (3'-phosphate/5'-hydroxy nucleic acid ligase)
VAKKKKKKQTNDVPSVALREVPLSYRTWGAEYIDAAARKQMDAAMTMTVAVAGALMPDAHVGYGLPIGGVLATENAVIPYAVGVDIACRMRLSVYEQSPIMLKQKPGQFEKALLEQTRFGAGAKFAPNERAEHEVLDAPEWDEVRRLKSLKDKAYEQLGTSGSGNHFVEWGAFELADDDDGLGLRVGSYLALLSHSGSRGVGYAIANHYSDIARYMHHLDRSVEHLGWLPMNKDIGQEYWLAMQIAGRYAAANHEVIHHRVAKAVGVKPILTVENHHNFAWEETYTDADGTEHMVIVHRKGATPAGAGVMGIIPGSMGDAGYVVRGRGVNASLNSASHGAGRRMSRRQARNTITKSEQKKYLKTNDVKLLGGDLDEAPQAYKNIDEVIAAQTDLVDIVGKFVPRIVRMDGKVK